MVAFLMTVDEPTKQDRLKQLKRLATIQDQAAVLNILVKELQRAASGRHIQIISELLMELGDLTQLQEPLWAIIENPQAADEIKDAANLILRFLGDDTDPNRYLDYLHDPEGLINRETERMLEVSTRNPEALIDFIDFIFSLPIEEQINLIESLQEDYPTDYLINIYIPALNAKPPEAIEELLLKSLGQTRSKRAALYLDDYLTHYADNPRLLRAVQKSISELKLAGIYKEENLTDYRQELALRHPLVMQSQPYQCFATIVDGIGNQGIIVSRQWENGDIAMMSVAVNDIHGIIDCFGFYQLSDEDFQRICEKFHEESSKIPTDFAYCLQKLTQAETLNRATNFRIPYEYSCWKIMLSAPETPAPEAIALCRQWHRPEWSEMSANLYHHPDFRTWFLEEGDHPVVTELLTNLIQISSEQSAEEQVDNDAFLTRMDVIAEAVIRGLLVSDWRDLLIGRLADTAVLLDRQNAETFRTLAATEVVKLLNYDPAQVYPLDGFVKQYGRRCVEEYLLRLKYEGKTPASLNPQIDHVIAQWSVGQAT